LGLCQGMHLVLGVEGPEIGFDLDVYSTKEWTIGSFSNIQASTSQIFFYTP